MTKVPENLQGVLWSRDVANLDIETDKVYIIHQVLVYGSFEQMKWLSQVYSKKDIEDTFVFSPKKIYT